VNRMKSSVGKKYFGPKYGMNFYNFRSAGCIGLIVEVQRHAH